MKFPSVILLAGCIISASVLSQESIVLQPEAIIADVPYAGVHDVILISGIHKKLNYGGANSLWIGAGNDGEGNSVRRSLLRFDLNQIIPEGKKVAGAVLTLHCVQANGSPLEWEVYAVASENAHWVEGVNARGSSETGVCSWDHMLNFYQEWVGGEGLGEPGGGYAATPLFTRADPIRNREIINIELPAELIEEWRKGSNGGLLFRMVDESAPDAFIRFASSENTDGTLRPSLEITLQP